MRVVRLLLLFCLLHATAKAQGTGTRRIVLIGGGGPDAGPVLQAVKKQITLDAGTTVLFLGDGVAPTDNAGAREAVWRAQAALVGHTPSRAFFMPGDAEWAGGAPSGYDQVRQAAQIISHLQLPNVRWLPSGGCPGPEAVSIGEDCLLILLDSQWWLHEYDKPDVQSDCPQRTEQQVLDALNDLLEDNRDKLILLATHHPFRSTGLRSGYFGVRQHLFPLTDIPGWQQAYLPLPVVGSIYPIVRSVGISRQDRSHAAYQRMINALEPLLRRHPHVVRLAGHDHSLQLLQEDEGYYIVSGAAGAAARAARAGQQTLFAGKGRGFSVVELTPEKEVRVQFYELKGDSAALTYRKPLFRYDSRPPLAPDTAGRREWATADSVTAAAYPAYGAASAAKRRILGDNHRAVWAAPVRMEVFHIGSERGGFTITGIGGGNTTHTLQLKDRDGKSWALRPVNKDPGKLLPEALRETVASDVMQDMISASFPYAALATGGLSAPLGLPHPEERLFFVPNDTALGYYRTAFANTVCLLEERIDTAYGSKTKSTWDVFENRIDKGAAVDQPLFLKARMLDLLLADYDRHYEQWKWGVHDSNGRKIYLAVPKDRDQAFYYPDGLLMKWFVFNRLPYLQGLQYDIAQVARQGYVARDIDALFLNELGRQEWESVLRETQTALTDEAIGQALAGLPPEIQALSGAQLSARLKSRRDRIAERGMDYYRFLARKVTVPGTNGADVFRVQPDSAGVQVQVFSRDTTGDAGPLLYQRVFREGETREIRLYGLNGDDDFRIDPAVHTGIRFRIVGGTGADSFRMAGRARNLVYDRAGEGNVLLQRRRTTNMISRRQDANAYTFREDNYNSFTFPTINLGFNIEDLFFGGGGIAVRQQGFRSTPYGSQQQLVFLFAPDSKAWQVRYNGTFNDLYRHYDLLIDGVVKDPALSNFFGLGNETVRQAGRDIHYYRVRYGYVATDVLFRKRLAHQKLHLAIGPSFYHYWNRQDKNSGRILSRPSDAGLDSVAVFSPKTYGGGKLQVQFRSIDNELVPVRGIAWNTELSVLAGLNGDARGITRLQSDFSLYAPLSSNRRLVFITHLGGGHIFSPHFEYFQAFSLGADHYLRGYRKSRFSGSSAAYASAELRLKLLDVKSYILPGELGLTGFYDAGRVWVKGERSDVWHHAAGGGLYYVPLQQVLVSALVSFSGEEMLFNIGVGARLNLTF